MKITVAGKKLPIANVVCMAAVISADMIVAYAMGYKYGCKMTRAKDLKLFYHFNPEVAKDFMAHCSEMYVKHAK